MLSFNFLLDNLVDKICKSFKNLIFLNLNGKFKCKLSVEIAFMKIYK